MRIYQGYESEPMKKFMWMKRFRLRRYDNMTEPLVVFGCYHKKDIQKIKNHKNTVIVVWMGKDSLQNKFEKIPVRENIIHATWIPKIKERLCSFGYCCMMLKPPMMEEPNPLLRGDKVYVYLQKTKPEYHNDETVYALETGHDLLIGDHSVKRSDWYGGENNNFYKQAFIGLCLSDYAGGGMSVVEMGLRGIKVVTNVLELPNCIPWKTKEDIEKAIRKESVEIGKTDIGMANEVYRSLAGMDNCFNLKKMAI